MSNKMMELKTNILDGLSTKINTMQSKKEIDFPQNYSYQNALKSAWLILQNTQDRNKNNVLESCEKTSIFNALFDMLCQGLNPGKKQCYFIAYGKQLQLQRSYFGTKSATLNLSKVKNIIEQVVYNGDVLEYEIKNGRKYITKHVQKFGNINVKKIVGAYCIIETNDNDSYTEIMTMDQIKQAWKQSKMSPVENSGDIKANSVHGKFTDQMALKTVINRACKSFFNTSNDKDLLVDSFNRTTTNEYKVDSEEVIVEEIETNANTVPLDIPEETKQPNDNEEKVESIDTETGEITKGDDPY